MKRLIALFASLLSLGAQAQEVRTTKVIGMVVQYLDAPRSVTMISALSATLFTSRKSTAKFFAEGSQGKHILTGTVHPTVLTLQQTRPIGKCLRPNHTAVLNAALAAGINFSEYTHAVLIAPKSSLGCNGGVAVRLSYPGGYLPMAVAYGAGENGIAHEILHGFSLGHANRITCGADVIGIRCTTTEYGNRFDVMGDQYLWTTQGAFRTKLGWITPIVHTAGRATYTIGAAANPGALPSAIKVQVPQNANGIQMLDQWSLWIEYRAPFGFDSGMGGERYVNFATGAYINLTGYGTGEIAGKKYSWVCQQRSPCLLDLTPGDGNYYNGGLVVGRTWVEKFSGTSITVDSRTDTTLTVTVSTPN